jgi:Asp-tRNA(Asn)/Glu-tRNA(Gln) amidotransferase A subunit family amidase
MSFAAHMARHDGRPVVITGADRTSPFGPLATSVRDAFHSAADAVAELLGAPIEWREPEGFFPDGDPELDWPTVTSVEHVASLGREWVLAHMDEFDPTTQSFLRTGLNVSLDEYLAARRRRYLYTRTLDELLGETGLLLTPSVASDGWLADGRLTAQSATHGLPYDVSSTATQNITGHPALSVPMGLLPTGLPFGLQITAGHYHDYRLLDIAAVIEEAYPWARTAPDFEGLDSILQN